MKRLLILLFLSVSFHGFSQTCAPYGIGFYFQEEVDRFHRNYPGCKKILGDVIIAGDDISKLDSLLGLTGIGGYFEISNTVNLFSLFGLDSLRAVGSHFGLYSNSALMSMKNLANLDSVGDNFELFGNLNLQSLRGLKNLSYIGGAVWFGSNPMLTTFNGLAVLSEIHGTLQIDHNPSLLNIDSLICLRRVNGPVSISFNSSLASLHGLDSINAGTISGLYLSDNDSLRTCSAYSICRYLELPVTDIEIFANHAGCNSRTEVQNACDTMSAPALNAVAGWKVYPVPFGYEFNIEAPADEMSWSFTLVDLLGRQVMQSESSSGRCLVNGNRLRPGMYLLLVRTPLENLTFRLIKE